jgi:GNAT superfamily N-acetyltransferase
MELRINRVETGAQRRQFIDLPHALFAADPNYVPELYIAQKKLLDSRQNPFFQHAEAELWLAEKNGRLAGRIACIRNGNHNTSTGAPDGFFGFFDVAADYEVAAQLLKTAEAFAARHGFRRLIGPVNFSTNDTCGQLVEGFDSPPAIMMTYQPAYHAAFLERYGFQKKMDLYAYRIFPGKVDEKALRLRPQLEERLARQGIRIRTLNLKDFTAEVDRFREIYNAAWEKNWGFVPMSEAEFRFAAEDLKSIVDTDFVFLAEHNGRPVGTSLTIPNLNEVFIRMPRGRLLPTGIFKLLIHRRKVRSVRVLTLGIIEQYRNSGIDACFYARSIEQARRKGIQWGEASWILENNVAMNRAIEHLGGERYKTYRIYDKEVSA